MLIALVLLVLELVNVEHVYAQGPEYDCKLRNTGMNPVTRQQVISTLNVNRHHLATGFVQIAPFSTQNFPPAADMLMMTYSCDLEKQASKRNPCYQIPPRRKFDNLDMNYGYVKTRRTYNGGDAVFLAQFGWWSTHFSNPKFKKNTPHTGDYPMIPFFLMANGASEKVGCAVRLCPGYFSVTCVYGPPYIAVGKPLYTEGQPCTQCPYGYVCDDKTKTLCKKREHFYGYWK